MAAIFMQKAKDARRVYAKVNCMNIKLNLWRKALFCRAFSNPPMSSFPDLGIFTIIKSISMIPLLIVVTFKRLLQSAVYKVLITLISFKSFRDGN